MKVKVIVGVIISLLFLFFAFWKVDIAAFWDALLTARYLYFFPAIAVAMTAYFVRAYRWKYLLILQKDISLLTVFSAMSIGFFTNNVLPMRAGEFLRAYVVGRDGKVPMSAALATVVVERIIDVFSLLFIAAAALLILPVPQNRDYEVLKNVGIVLALVEVCVLVFCFMLLEKQDFTVRAAKKILSIFPKRVRETGAHIIKTFIDGLEIMKAVHQFFRLAWTSLVIWLLTYLQVFIILQAFAVGLTLPVMLIAAVIIMIASAFSVTIPSAPGFVGPFHWAAQRSLSIFSVDQSIALAFATLLHLSSYIPITIVGFYFFLRGNVRFAAARAEREESADGSPA